MFKLMKLEMRKGKFGWYVKGAIIANLFLAAFSCAMGFIGRIEENFPFSSYSDVFIVLGALVRATFIVFGAVLISRLVIEEYKTKTISIMFTYPVSRKKFIASKLLVVSGITFITIFISNLIVVSAFISINSFFNFVPHSIDLNIALKEVASMMTYAIAAAGTTLVSLYFGLRKKSVPATILSSLLIVGLISQHSPGYFSTASIIYIPLGLAAVGILSAFWAIRNVDSVDVV
ncbi:ABC transporter permease [Metabacillus fastidiosus]|uniref:ABC transporter permease n=1 Tax=Metabacillus fastidiosus TaxID=1458 RepID=UPI002DB76024|nr:ABC transporter permease [Metabacillus fastidiosus]MEC2076689.1 ABC transporter permease [Metabacillus fastidiosus]